MDWADKLAAQILEQEGIVRIFDNAGYCRKCNQPLAGAAVDLTDLKRSMAQAFREIKEAYRG